MIPSNILIIVVAFAIAVVAIYILYSIILFQGGGKNNEEFQLTTKNILEQVTILFDKGEYALVELLSIPYLDRMPKNTDVRLYLAKALYNEKKYNSAIKHCGEILKIKPNDIDTHIILGKCYAKKEILSKAIKELEYVTERRKEDKESLEMLAKLYNETEQYYMAIAAYEALADLTTNDNDMAEIQLIIAELNETTHNYPEAFEAYKTRLGIYPKDVNTNKKLAELHIKINNHSGAIETLLYMLTFVTEPKMLLWVYETLVDLYEQIEEYDKAIEYAEKMLDIQGSDKFKIRDKIAQFNIKLGNSNDGILILEDLALLSQNGFEITLELAEAYINIKEYNKALERYNLLLDKALPREAKIVNLLICDLYIKWANDMLEVGTIEKAFTYLKNAIQYNAINSEAYFTMAQAYCSQNSYNEAIENLLKALDFDKEKQYHTKYLLLLADCHHELGNFFEEKKALTDLLKIDEKNAEGLYKSGLMYVNQHDIRKAEELFLAALDQDPDLIQAKYNLALIYENNNKERAKELYIEVLEQDPSYTEARNALADLTSSDY